MARDAVVSGRFYYCSFTKNDFTSLNDRQLVLVLVSQFRKSLKESLVAYAINKAGSYEPDLERVYTVPSDKLDDFEWPIDKETLANARKNLVKKINEAK
ncbi:hypothetical protein Amsp01_081160 [Amycolatopsis sp. NBRC 101858]|nr:hypothetical protein Amsp01_081160 [Amycolatopsis sp. NBRC 101858]